MKPITFSFLFFFLFCMNSFGQNPDSSKVKGFYIAIYSKMQIENIEKNKLLQKAGKPYFQALGTESYRIFIASDEIKQTLPLSIKNFSYDFRETNYFLPQKNSDTTTILKTINNKIDFKQEASYFNNSDFYSSEENPNYLYRIYYSEGDALTYHLPKTKENRLKFGLFADEVSRGNMITVVIIYHYTLVANNFSCLYNFKKWTYKP